LKFVFAIFALVGLLIASPTLIKMAKQAEWNREHQGASLLDKPAMKVWVSKQVGYYYCPQSALYGKAQPGVWMTQARALEVGYRSATGEFCQ
jgi:hypothetical protein